MNQSHNSRSPKDGVESSSFSVDDLIARLESIPVNPDLARSRDLPHNGEMSNSTGYLFEEHVRSVFREYPGASLIQPHHPCFNGQYRPGFREQPHPKASPCRQPERWSSRVIEGKALVYYRGIDGKSWTAVVDENNGYPIVEFDVLAVLPDRYVIGEVKCRFNKMREMLFEASGQMRRAQSDKRLLSVFLPEQKPIEYWYMCNKELTYEFARLECEDQRFGWSLANFLRRGNRLIRLNASFDDYKAMAGILAERFPGLIQSVPFPDVRRELSQRFLYPR